MKSYMIRRYARNGNLHDRQFADTLEEAIRIRQEWIDKNHIKRFGLCPTIWESNGKEYFRLEGF